MRRNWSNYVLKLMWLIGFIALLLISSDLEQSIRQTVATTFKPQNMFWFYANAPLVIGVYISFIFIREWSFKLNVPLLLCITVPCFIVTFYFPIAYVIASLTTATPGSFSVPSPFWMLDLNSLKIPSLVAGLTLMIGIFGSTGQLKK